MRILAVFSAVLLFGLWMAAAARQANQDADDVLVPGKRMVLAVQYPFEQKVEFNLFPTGRIPDLKGSAEVRRRKDAVHLKVELDGPPPSQLKPEYRAYVVWAVTPAGRFHRLGTLTSGKLKTKTSVRSFGLVITAEADPHRSAAPGKVEAVMESGLPSAKRRIYPMEKVLYQVAVVTPVSPQ